jgi:hypothetical protein
MVPTIEPGRSAAGLGGVPWQMEGKKKILQLHQRQQSHFLKMPKIFGKPQGRHQRQHHKKNRTRQVRTDQRGTVTEKIGCDNILLSHPILAYV